jgi:hypothetical protein
MTKARALISGWVDDELHNWSRWCWSGAWPHPMPAGRAESAEGRYVPESVYGAEVEQDEAARRPPPANARRAEIVQRCYATRLTTVERRSLVVTYVKPFPSSQQARARRAGVTVDVYETALMSAARKVSETFSDARVSD